MASMNKVFLLGNLTRDPELSHTQGGSALCKFGIAVNRKWKDKNSGDTREEVCFVDCVAWNRTAEIINQYLSKGSMALIQGRLQFNQWEDQQGNKRSKLEVVVDDCQFMPSGKGENQRKASSQQSEHQAGGYSPSGDDCPF